MTPAFGLIIIGDEILSGKRADKHLPRVIELLQARGLSLAWARCVGDDPRSNHSHLRDAFASADVVFSCGGIGATPDDHTRQCAASRSWRWNWSCIPQARELIAERMRDLAPSEASPTSPIDPTTCTASTWACSRGCAQIIANPYNKIPGFSCSGP
jgi:molybdopterin-biosynthesis enzyme MoeA-like protein